MLNTMDINVDLLQRSKQFLMKNPLVVMVLKKRENVSNRELAEKLQKPIIRKFSKRKVKPPFTDNIRVLI